ncbi:hypothetical protein [Pseudoclavibacter sp. AY1H1]|uniref:hypothetical protein n=1 Tax=Pseudoclavibacter sp. AY1H1 TaxID=2080584 RepID=UPI0011B09103|nr:hypothetical protein [Pseudoclavibacter sp. AY1H1]
MLAYVLEKKSGASWLQEAVSAETIAKWEARRLEEERKRTTRGVAAVASDPLAYAEFYELVGLVKKNWNDVAPALGKKAVTGALLDRFDDLRNTVAHSRDLLPFEEALLAGISGEIRNRVTLYMSTQAPSGEHFARIEEVVDSFGNRIDGVATLQTSNPYVQCDQVLEVGDVVTFRCRGTDPHGRGLRWHLAVAPGGVDQVIVEGDEVELRWTIEPRHVSSRSYAIVHLVADSAFHRWTEGVEGMGLFFYQITPPHS